jgi:predicted nicotinamide N-methyase
MQPSCSSSSSSSSSGERLWQCDEGSTLDEWEEDIPWGFLLAQSGSAPAKAEEEPDHHQHHHFQREVEGEEDGGSNQRRQRRPQEEEEEEEEDEAAALGGGDDHSGLVVTESQISGKTISIKQQPLFGIAHQVWHASLVLTDFFNSAQAFPPACEGASWWSGKRVLELGAGTGIPGIFLASKGARVILTDLPEVVPLMQSNIQANAHLFPSSNCCEALPLAWGEKHDIPLPVDVVVASDVVYWEHLFAPLAQTLQAICFPETVVFLSWQKRRKNDRLFFKMIAKHFTLEEIDFSHVVEREKMSAKHLKKTHLFKLKPKLKKHTTSANNRKCRYAQIHPQKA